MGVVASTHTKRGIVLVLALALAIVLSYFSIRSAMAAHYSDLGTLEGHEKAARLEPSDPENWYRLGNYLQQDLERGDPERAIQAYLHSLALNPQSANTWAQLAAIYEGQGQLEAARAALLNAKRAYPASADISWRYGNFLLRTGETKIAFHEIGRAVEQEPGRAWEAFSLFQHFVSDDEEILNSLPHQEKVYLDVIRGLDQEGHIDSSLKAWNQLFKVHNEMKRKGLTSAKYEITQSVLFSLVDQLISWGSITEAERVWREALNFMEVPSPPDPPESLVWDGGFETDTINGGFAWRINPSEGSSVRFAKTLAHSGARSLEVKFDGKHNVDFHGACQVIAVNPETTYGFSAWLRTDNVTTDMGILFRLNTPRDKLPEVFTPQLTGTHPWTQIHVRWTSPQDVHLLQVCAVRGRSAKLYNTIAGTVWIDDVQLIPVRVGENSVGRTDAKDHPKSSYSK